MEQKKNIMDYDTVSLDDESSAVVIIDQTKLPGTTEIIALKTAQEIWDAIYLLQVRGAPAIGVAAAYGIYVLAKGIDTDNYDEFYAEFKKQKEYLDSSRPTAVNLSWALNRMEKGLGGKVSALEEIKEKYGFDAHAIVTMQDVIDHLYNRPYKGEVYIDDTLKKAIDEYYAVYGA